VGIVSEEEGSHRLNPLLLPTRPTPRQVGLQKHPGITAFLPTISSGGPAATISPPLSGPRSMIQSAVLLTSRLLDDHYAVAGVD
jgi:hypothetical protein